MCCGGENAFGTRGSTAYIKEGQQNKYKVNKKALTEEKKGLFRNCARLMLKKNIYLGINVRKK